jgi:hypothetical protein
MQPRLQELDDALRATRAKIETLLESVPHKRWNERPEEGRWTIAELVEHLHRVEKATVRLLALKAIEARERAIGPETSTESVFGALGPMMELVAGRRIASERVAPRGMPADEAHAAVRQSREELHAVLAALDGYALGELRHEHPIFGDIDLYQWILFAVGHERRHLPQLQQAVDAVTKRSEAIE